MNSIPTRDYPLKVILLKILPIWLRLIGLRFKIEPFVDNQELREAILNEIIKFGDSCFRRVAESYILVCGFAEEAYTELGFNKC